MNVYVVTCADFRGSGLSFVVDGVFSSGLAASRFISDHLTILDTPGTVETRVDYLNTDFDDPRIVEHVELRWRSDGGGWRRVAVIKIWCRELNGSALEALAEQAE